MTLSLVATLLLLAALPALAQDVTWTEDFQTTAMNARPASWIDDGAFRTAPDPLASGNVVYGARAAISRQRAIGRAAPGERVEGGSHATVANRWFAAAHGFEYRGRFFRASDASLVGVTFFSHQPEGRDEYLLAMWRGSMRLFGPQFAADSGFVPQPGRWHRFAIRADDEGGATRIRARFWIDGQPEPAAWQLDASDRTTARLVSGRVGVWAAGGAAYVDDLSVGGDIVQNADHTPPSITFVEEGRELAEANAFNRDVRVDVHAVDGSGIASLAVTLDGAPFRSGDLIAAESSHELIAKAIDGAGNSATATVALLIDKTPPVITVRHGGQVLISNALYAASVTPDVTVQDLTETTVTATLNGALFTLGGTITEERAHALIVTATDAVGWTTTTEPIRFTIDRTAPAIAFLEAGRVLVQGGRNVLDHDARVQVQVADPGATVALTVDGQRYDAGAPIAGEGTHVIRARVTDGAGNVTDAEVAIVIDKMPPVITVTPIPTLTNQIVRPAIAVDDATATTLAATLNGALYASGTAIDGERRHTLVVSATDEAGWTTTLAPIVFTIDRTPPAIAFVSPNADAMLAVPRVLVTGEAGDAVSVVVNGVAAMLDAATFAVTIELAEGANTLTAVATDAAGNASTLTRALRVDTRAPQLTVASPAVDACLDATQVELRGTVSDAGGAAVRVNGVNATVIGNAWTAIVPTPNETRVVFTIEAADPAGHAAVATVPVMIDRTRPVLELTESNVSFGDVFTNRALAIFGRALDDDPSARVTMTLDGQPYVSGTPVSAEQAYVLAAVAHDCTGHASDARLVHFTIDRTPPSISALAPASGTVLGTKPAITGRLSEEATVAVEGTGESAVRNGLDFSLTAALTEGANRLTLVARDRAGNESRVPLAFTVKTTTPTIAITESGEPLAADALFNRIVTPVIRTSDPNATIAATLDGQTFTSGNAVAADGRHTLSATVTDVVRHTASASAVFTIDRTPPRVTITSPAPNATILGASIEVRGTVDAGDVVRVVVNGVTASLSGTSFSATVPADFGPSPILATAFDRAGNAGSASVDVSRADDRIGILLTSPADGLLTNRPTTVVAGQVLTPSAPRSVTVNGIELPVDAAGAFRKIDFALTEGDNAITAAAGTSSVTVHVIADFTPPVLKVLADGVELADAARFATPPAITLQATDNPAGVATQLVIDGASSAALAAGGHTLTAIARDAAGNETRVDRAFVIGQFMASIGCSIGGLDPLDGASVFGEHVRLTGRAGAEAVLINGVQAALAEGTFCADVRLVPGRNEVVLQCARLDGTPTADAPVTLVLNRWLDPEITITSPASGAVLTTNRITVTGTVGAGVISGDVNGLAFTPAGGAFAVNDVAVAPGLNVIAARARTSSDRMSVATARVIARTGAPQLAITSPLGGTSTGAAIDVSGVYTNVDPATIAIGNSSVTTQPLSDTTGRFTATVSIASATTITATGRSYAGVAVSASVDVSRVTGAPSIAIAAPFDNAFVTSTTESVHVTGTSTAGDGAQISVNGVAAAISGASFSADVDVAPGAMTPIVARVNAADGSSATDVIRVIRFAAPLGLKETFPAAGAADVDRGIAIVVLMNNVLDAATVVNAVRVADAANNTIAGDLFVDREAITFAPHAPLRAGERYTVTLATALRDVAGGALGVAQAFGFTAAGSAPTTPPTVDQSDAAGCLTAQTITGRTSVPGARVRLEVDGVSTTTTANAANAFTFHVTLSGQPGDHALRVRELGSDGTLSPERALCIRVNCAAPQILGATLDRGAKKLAIQFSKPMDAATLALGSSIVLEPALAGTLSTNAAGDTATIAFDADLRDVTLRLTVKTAARDRGGVALAAEFAQTFTPGGTNGAERGKGFVTGAVYDATNGRPLAGASVAIGAESMITDARGRYSRALDEGAYTIRAGAAQYSTVWRQVIVPAGAGVVPIDIRLTKRGAEHVASGAGATLTHGGDTTVTKAASLTLTTASLPNGRRIRLTSVGAQSLAGLLPLGWSPLASAEIAVDDTNAIVPLPGARLTFTIAAAEVTAASQNLSLAWYDDTRDEWRVEVPVAGGATFDITQSGSFALIYADRAAALAHPPPARAGASLSGVANPCVAAPDVCRLTGRTFTLTPKAVVPSGRSVATLVTEGAAKPYPSGTVVQAFIDEQLNLADGRVLVEPPFAADLLVYRNLAGDIGVADFHLAPSAQAATVILRDGVEQIRIVDYPGRIARGTLLGAEGGRLPGGDGVTIDVPAGATLEPLHASVAPIDVASITAVAGFRVAGAFSLTLTRATSATVEGITLAPPSLLKPARATVSVASPTSAAASQVLIGELVSPTPFGALVRLTALTSPGPTVGGARLFTTRDAAPVEGIVREGRYVVLVAESPIAFAHGQVRALDANGPAVANALVKPNILGVLDLTEPGGLFVVPVLAKPAAPFSLTPRTVATGDGATRTHPSSPDPDAMIDVGALPLTAQPPLLVSVTPAADTALDATAAFVVQARFDAPIDPTSVTGGITVTDRATGAALAGTVAAAGSVVTFNAAAPLAAASSYAITIAPSIRGTNGAPFGRTHVTSFTTRAVPAGNASIRADRIHITIPDADGRSTISGTAGALPTGAQAIAVRRTRFFIETYQTTVTNADGSFSFDAGHRHPTDRIAITDAIDLRVLDPVSHAIVAVIPLTPFVSADGKSFLAPADAASRFTSADGITVTVPEGAFATPTVVRVGRVGEDAFAAVPDFASELNFVSGVSLTFEGTAAKPLEVDFPIPVNTPTANRTFLLGRLVMSARGPRVEIDDLLRVDGNLFTTRTAPSFPAPMRAVSTSSATSVARELLRIVRSGTYGALEIHDAFAFVTMNGIPNGIDLVTTAFRSIVASRFYLDFRGGRVVIPVRPNLPFVVEGVDADTGLPAFTRAYDAVPPAEAGFATEIDSPVTNESGPYPVFASPMRVDTIEIPIAGQDLTSVPGFTIRLDPSTSRVRVTRNGAAPEKYTVINASTSASSTTTDPSLELDAAVGHHLSILSAVEGAEPTRVVEVVFSEPIVSDAPADVIHLERKSGDSWLRLDALADYDVSSGGRRVRLILSNELQRGGEYRLVLDAAISDRGSPPKLLIGGPLELPFAIRAPRGDLLGEPFRIGKGGVRDLALDGNILFVSALEGGLYAYDVSDPAALLERPPMARANAFPEVHAFPGESWAVTVDRHGRIWTTALTDRNGVVRSFRVEDFINTAAGTKVVQPTATGPVSWRVGVNIGLPIGTDLVTDSNGPEAIPRKIQVALQDESMDVRGGAELDALPQANALDVSVQSTGSAGDFRIYDVTVGKSRDNPYRLQRVTVENRTLNLRWSDDIHLDSQSGVTIRNVVVRNGDLIRISRNLATWGTVALFGFGVGLYDLNAIESNHLRASLPQLNYFRPVERLALTDAKRSWLCSDANPPGGLPCLPESLTWISDAAVVASSPKTFHLFGLESTKGIINVVVTDGAQIERDSGIAFTGAYPCASGTCYVDHPRLAPIRAQFAQHNRRLTSRFTTVARYDSGTSSYALVAANQFGILVIDLAGRVGTESLADVIWVPAGASAVRVLAGSHYATAIDGRGRALLIDLSRIDERATVESSAELFATVKRALASGPDPGDALAFGSDDPRIVWKSEPSGLGVGALAPVGDPDTGFLFHGDLLQQTVRVLAGSDPRIVVKANLGDGLATIGSIVPLGIAPPKDVLKCIPANAGCEASLAAFRLETSLPAGIGAFDVAIESERLPGVATEQTSLPLPRAHLRTTSRAPEAELRPQRVTLEPLIPASLIEEIPQLRLQRGANRFQSKWIVALADPRASHQFDWNGASGATQAEAGCYFCTRPPSLRNDTNVLEIFTLGRFIGIRPETSPFAGTRYAYLGEDHRLEGRVTTYAAELIHPPSVAVAAQNPPVADGMLQETTYLHSGEIEAGAVDLDAGGRAGFNVVIDRTYRSRTVGAGELGPGWTSSMFARLRELPDLRVEYRDSAGEVWIFTPSEKEPDAYSGPPGLPLKLTRTDRGWSLMDLKRRFTFFDTFGRLKARTDHFADPRQIDAGTARGNVIRYLYDSSGRLGEIVDPLGRTTTLIYWKESERALLGAAPGRLHEIVDWRLRRVTYAYDTRGRLANVSLPDSASVEGVPPEYTHVDGNRPRIRYQYTSINDATSYNDVIELGANLTSITDPQELSPQGNLLSRVDFEYGLTGATRDRVLSQKWPCATFLGGCIAKTATFVYDTTVLHARVQDILGQWRQYTIQAQADGRMHFASANALDVPVIREATASVPTSAAHDLAAQPETITTVFDQYDAHGQLLKVTLPGGAVITSDYDDAESSPLGRVGATLFDDVGVHLQTVYDYEEAITLDTIVTAVGRQYASTINAQIPGSAFRDAQSPNRMRDKVVRRDTHDDVATKTITRVNASGQPEWTAQLALNLSESGDDPNPAATQVQRTTYEKPTGPAISRGRAIRVESGGGQLASSITYAEDARGGQTVKSVDVQRDVETFERFDAYDRPVERTVKSIASGTILRSELFGYDASGRLAFTSTTESPFGTVTTTSRYDSLGRVLETRTNKRMKVLGSDAALVVRNEYDLINGIFTTFDPALENTAAAKTETTVDGLGRSTRVRRVGTSGSVVEHRYGYDRRGNLCYETDDVREATLRFFDALGREKTTVRSDGIRAIHGWSPWDELADERVIDPAGTLVARTAATYTSHGTLLRTAQQVDAGGRTRASGTFIGNGGARIRTGVAEVGALDAALGAARARVTDTYVDRAGRTNLTRSGELAFNAPLVGAAIYAESEIPKDGYDGALARNVVTREPRAGISWTTSTQYDAIGRPVKTIEPGDHETVVDYAAEPNGISTQRPGEKPTIARYDGRGLVIENETQDPAAVRRFTYDTLGNLRRFTDEEQKITTYDVDDLGRPMKTTYPDGATPANNSTEETRYEASTGRMQATRDRTGLWLWFDYDTGGRVTKIHTAGRASEPAQEPARRREILRSTYDAAGRLTEVRNADAARQYEAHDLLGRPKVTRQIRYADASGLALAPKVLDIHSQAHQWSVFDGERLRWRMPVAGTSFLSNAPSTWEKWIDETRESGDLVSQRAASASTGAADAVLSETTWRSPGRLQTRRRHGTGPAIASTFGYADPTAAAPPEVPPVLSLDRANGLLRRVETKSGGTLVGGEIRRTLSRQIAQELDLGLGQRRSVFAYDARQRLLGNRLLEIAAGAAAASASESLTPADFRAGRAIEPPAFADDDDARLADAPSDWTATQTAAHQLKAVTLALRPEESRIYEFAGGRRTGSAGWSLSYDDLGRLVRAELAEKRRIDYAYDPSGRLVGRSVSTPQGNGWALENRTTALARDGLPPAVTFYWDDVADRLLAAFEAGASTATEEAPAPDAGLLRQYLHADAAYDDPIRVRIGDKTYFPILDEAGTGNLTAVLDEGGHLVERVLYADAYGDAPRYLHGPLVDRITFTAKTDADARLESVTIDVHLTDPIDASTIDGGARLAGITTAPATPDAYTLRWTLTAAEWAPLAENPTLDLTLTDHLRALGWGSTPLMPPPSWARVLHRGIDDSLPATPFRKREPLTTLTALIASLGANAEKTESLYAVPDLYLAASDRSKSQLLFDFKAWPFRDPASGLVYARNRWYDATTGTFLTPDPVGYRDASNLYAFCGNDPVNCDDPLGLYDPAAFGHKIMHGGDWLKNKVSQASLSTPESGIGFVDAGNRTVNVALETTVNSGIDLAAGFVGGFFTIGERSGEAIGEYDSATPWRSGGRVAFSVGIDALATVGYATGIAGVANKTITAASEALMPSAMFDMSITAAGEAEILGSLAPRITVGMLERQRMVAAIEAMPSPYAGVREASAYLKTMGVSRADRVRILQSFEPEGMAVRTAGGNEFGTRYYGGVANPGGAYLFETFPASRGTLALRQPWNAMTGFKQWQIRLGTTVIEGSAAAQGRYLPGTQIQKFILDWGSNLL